MKRLTFLAIVVIAALSVRAQIPQKFNYQAIVRGNAGTVIANKPLGMRFSIRDGSATGTIQYSETQLTTSNTYGLVNLQVGAGTSASGAFTAITWNTGNKFLQVEVDTTGSANYVALATVELITVPYALQAVQAKEADSAGIASRAQQATVADSATRADSSRAAGMAVAFSGLLAGDVAGPQGATVIQAGAVTTAKLADNAVSTAKMATGAVQTLQLADNAVTAAKIPAGQVVKSIDGVHDDLVLTASGAAALSVNSAGALNLAVPFGGDGTATTVSHSDHDHVGQFWSSSSPVTLGLINSGVLNPALYVTSNNTDFNIPALEVQITNTTSQSAGIFSETLSNNVSSAAIVGQASGAGLAPLSGATGVTGIADANYTFGVVGSATPGKIGNYAGYFGGNVVVNGNLVKASGSFKIDHPLDPANKYLSHSFVESPDMMNIYNGNVVLDGSGAATITMPDWFEALNKDFRYQLTAIGKPSPNLYIAQEISGNKFRIAGGSPGAKVSWTVTGIRHDAYANAHRIPVEEVKEGAERGKYMTPEVFGKTAQQGIFSMPSMSPKSRQVKRPLTPAISQTNQPLTPAMNK